MNRGSRLWFFASPAPLRDWLGIAVETFIIFQIVQHAHTFSHWLETICACGFQRTQRKL